MFAFNLVSFGESYYGVFTFDLNGIRIKKEMFPSGSGKHLTFVETSYTFNINEFKNFIKCIEDDKTTQYAFDKSDICDFFMYHNNKFKINLSSYASNLLVEIPINETTGKQICKELTKFLEWTETL
jgi:hypothetical protein